MEKILQMIQEWIQDIVNQQIENKLGTAGVKLSDEVKSHIDRQVKLAVEDIAEVPDESEIRDWAREEAESVCDDLTVEISR